MWVYFLTPVLLTLFYFILNKFINLNDINIMSEFNKVRFEKFKPIYQIIYLFLSFTSSYFLAKLFIMLNINFHDNLNSKHELYYYANNIIIWLIPSFFLALILVGLILKAFAKLILKDDFNDFNLVMNEYNGYQTSKLEFPTLIIFSSLIPMMIYFITNMNFYIEKDHIYIHELFSFKNNSYHITDIKYIEASCIKKSKLSKLQIILKDESIFELTSELNTEFFNNDNLKKLSTKLNYQIIGNFCT